MSHLAAAGVASTENEHFDAVLFCVHCGCAHEEGEAYQKDSLDCFHVLIDDICVMFEWCKDNDYCWMASL